MFAKIFATAAFYRRAHKGEFPDDRRIGYRKRHIANRKEIVEACHRKGYFYWSFMDNFEWSLDIPSDSGLHMSMMMR